MTNKDQFFKITLIVAIILLSILIYLVINGKSKTISAPYYAVYLKTGDLYFGQLKRFFNSYTLTRVYVLQRDQNGEFSVQKFDQAVYQPEDRLILNKDNIIWLTEIQDNSPLISILEGKQATTVSPTTLLPEVPTSSPDLP